MNIHSFNLEINHMNAQKWSTSVWFVGLGIAGLLGGAIAGGILAYETMSALSTAETTSETPEAIIASRQIVALGRLEPESEVISLSEPLALEGDRVAEVRVHVGDRVEAGQVIAVLDSRARLERRAAEAQDQVQVAERRLAQVRAGAKSGAIAAQRAIIAQLEADLIGTTATQTATLARLRAELQNADAEFERFNSLYQAGAVSASERDAKRLTLDAAQAQVLEAEANQGRSVNTLRAQIEAARSTLEELMDVRPEDVAIAQAEVDRSIEALALATTELEQTQIRAPIAGQVLKVHLQPGEKVGDRGIVELGHTTHMMVVAEVDESDIRHVKLGQIAVITGSAFEGELRGHVVELGRAVNRQSVFSTQPGKNLDSRVIDVRIALTPVDSQAVRNLTNLQVQAAIDVGLFR